MVTTVQGGADQRVTALREPFMLVMDRMVINLARPNLLCKGFAVLFRPGAILRYRLQWRSTFGSASARAFRLGFSHAGAGSCFHAGTDVNNVALRLVLAAGVWWIPSLILRTAARSEEYQQK